MIKDFFTAFHMATLFLMFFIAFIAFSYVFHYLTIEISKAALITGVSADVDPILVSIVGWFQFIFAACALGFAGGTILAVMIKPESGGGKPEWRG